MLLGGVTHFASAEWISEVQQSRFGSCNAGLGAGVPSQFLYLPEDSFFGLQVFEWTSQVQTVTGFCGP